MRRAVFLDRDGVLNEPTVRHGKSYPPASVDDLHIYADAADACRALHDAGFLLVVVTNQPDVGRGAQKREIVEQMHAIINRCLPIDRIEVCYDPYEGTPDYKPAPGMLLRAATDLSIDLGASYMVGDRWRDVDCGVAAGCTTIFIDRGYNEPLRSQPHCRVRSLAEAADFILNPEGHHSRE